MFCQKSPPWPIHLGWPTRQAHSFIESTRLWSMWWEWLVFCECGFQSVCPLMEEEKNLVEASWWEKLSLVLMGRAMLSKTLVQFSVDGWGCVPSLLFTWGQTMVEVMKIILTSFIRSQACTATLCPQPCSRWPPTHASTETPGHSWANLGQSLVGSLLLSSGPWYAQGSVCAIHESVSPVLCRFWWLCGGVSGDLLRGGLCHTQVCYTQSPCPCGRPLLTCTSTGDTETQFCLSLCGTEYILWNARQEWSTGWNQDCREKYQ